MFDLSKIAGIWNRNPSASEVADAMDSMEHEIRKLRTELAKARNALRTCVGFEPFSGLEPTPASEALRSIDESGLLDLELRWARQIRAVMRQINLDCNADKRKGNK